MDVKLSEKTLTNKKVPLRELKRHTVRLVASSPSAALSPDGEGRGVPPSSPDGCGVSQPVLMGGVPPSSPDGEISCGTLWYPPSARWGTPCWPDGSTPPPRSARWAYPLNVGQMGYPPSAGWSIPLVGWMGVSPPEMLTDEHL